jgi:hypothetical protein
MINLKIDDAARVLVVEMKGMISESDIDGAIDALQASYPAVGVHLRGGERGGFSMLVDWQDLEGWEKGAKTLGTLTTRRSAMPSARWRSGLAPVSWRGEGLGSGYLE